MKYELFPQTSSSKQANSVADQDDKLYDLSMLYEMGDNDYIAQILTIFLKESPKELGIMKDAAAAKKGEIVGSYAHKLKSSTGIIGAARLSVMLAEIEEISRTGIFANDLTEMVEKAIGEYNKIQFPLQRVLKELDNAGR